MSSRIMSIFRLLLVGACLIPTGLAQDSLTIVKAARVYVGNGEVIENGMVAFKGGRIVQVAANITVPDGATVVDLGEGCVTPGLIDASTDTGLGSRSMDERSEIIPEDAALDGVDLFSKQFGVQAREGVTTVFVGGGTAGVIGPRGVVLKTAGAADQRVLDADGAVRAVFNDSPERGNRRPLGSAPPSLKSRRPTTKMGTVFVFRDAMTNALSKTGNKKSNEILTQVLTGKRKLFALADLPHEFAMARSLSREFGLKFVIERGKRVHECLDVVKSQGYSVIYGPQPASIVEARREKVLLSTPSILQQNKIPFALTAAGQVGVRGLSAQCTQAIRHGLSVGDAVVAVTGSPATLLGVDNRVGTLVSGKDADMVCWTRGAFGADSRPEVVFIGGVKVKGRSY